MICSKVAIIFMMNQGVGEALSAEFFSLGKVLPPRPPRSAEIAGEPDTFPGLGKTGKGLPQQQHLPFKGLLLAGTVQHFRIKDIDSCRRRRPIELPAPETAFVG